MLTRIRPQPLLSVGSDQGVPSSMPHATWAVETPGQGNTNARCYGGDHVIRTWTHCLAPMFIETVWNQWELHVWLCITSFWNSCRIINLTAFSFVFCVSYTFLLFVMHDQIENKLFEYGLGILYYMNTSVMAINNLHTLQSHFHCELTWRR